MWITDLMRRWTKIQKDIRTTIDTMDVFELKPVKMGLNQADPARFRFKTNPQKVEEFMDWLQEEMELGILEISEGPTRASTYSGWQDVYITSAYKKGMTDGLSALKKGGYISVGPDAFFDIDALFNTAIHAERVGYIYTRAYEELKGITAVTSQQISRTLAEGLANGFGPAQIARDLVDRVDKIGKTRSRILARTEVIRAHHKGKIQMYRDAGIVGVKVLAEWLTAGDDRVCPICAPQEGVVYPLDVIENLIPAHPQCRCTTIPAGIGEDPRVITGTDDFMDLREERAEVTAKVRSILDTGAKRGLSSTRIADQIFEATRP
jgi:SPP1 gp7 family putative phage head morphogenesis protein